MSKLIHYQCTCKLIIETTAAYILLNNVLNIFKNLEYCHMQYCYLHVNRQRSVVNRLEGSLISTQPKTSSKTLSPLHMARSIHACIATLNVKADYYMHSFTDNTRS